MGEQRHTPGLWEAEVHSGGEWSALIGDCTDPDASYGVFSGNISVAEEIDNPADAHLIAAAPDMLEALRKARVAIATWSLAPTEPLEEIDAAIARAEGRQ